MATIQVKIKGLTPGVLMHKYPMVEIPGFEKKTPEEQAEFAAYRDPETKELYIPGTAIQRCLVTAATYSKGKGRGSLQKNAAACVFVDPEIVTLKQKTYEIDSRPVVVPATKGRIVRHRPKVEKWEVEFTVTYDETLLSEKNMREIMDNAGSRCGLLDFRPNKNGPFGRFMVTSWKVDEAA